MKLIVNPEPNESPASGEHEAQPLPAPAAAPLTSLAGVTPFPSVQRPVADRGAADRAAQLGRDAVLSATPVRLLTMLYDRLLLDLSRAEQAQLAENWPAASEQLQHAQAILTELSGSLKLDVWDGADGLLALYTYVTNALVMANIHRDVARTRESIVLLEPLRQTWHDAAAILPAAPATLGAGALGIA
ncbi:flagellar export chaperone FliS [Microterricola pindariensis]|uniref:flagellar export chaperone FliS n=1 Tax=Microterricola pindariensis TaxID=478010 RepID=UPI00268F8586|nr:flagellar export chaperone FliS [Microterricola pindariensis]